MKGGEEKFPTFRKPLGAEKFIHRGKRSMQGQVHRSINLCSYQKYVMYRSTWMSK